MIVPFVRAWNLTPSSTELLSLTFTVAGVSPAENKVCAVLGGSLSSNALAEEATAAQLKIPFVCDNAAATEISGKNCNRYTFRLNTPVAVQSRMLAPFAAIPDPVVDMIPF